MHHYYALLKIQLEFIGISRNHNELLEVILNYYESQQLLALFKNINNPCSKLRLKIKKAILLFWLSSNVPNISGAQMLSE